MRTLVPLGKAIVCPPPPLADYLREFGRCTRLTPLDGRTHLMHVLRSHHAMHDRTLHGLLKERKFNARTLIKSLAIIKPR